MYGFIDFAECFVEIFCEKMPVSGMYNFEENVQELIKDWLVSYEHTEHCGIEVILSPHRFCFCIDKMPIELQKHRRQIKGPREIVDDEVLEKFAAKFEQSVEDLTKADGFWYATESFKSQETKQLIPALIEHILINVALPEKMYWGKEIGWIRPIRRVVCVFNGAPLIFQLNKLGVKASMDSVFYLNESEKFCFDSSAPYLHALRERNIFVKKIERRSYIAAQITAALEPGESIDQIQLEAAVSNIANISESAVVYKFPYQNNFNLPKELVDMVIINEQGYIATKNTVFTYSEYALADDGAQFLAGSMRALNDRLREVAMHWERSISKSPSEYLEMMKSRPLGKDIGSLYDQTERVEQWLKHFFPENVRLAKAGKYINLDLVMDICAEVSGLSGVAPAKYMALTHDAIAPILADSIIPEYDEEVPHNLSEEAAILSLCKRLDSFVGLSYSFGIPKGCSDPFALRRQCFSILKLGFYLDKLPPLSLLLQKTINLHTIRISEETYNQLMNFFMDKAKILLEKTSSQYGEYFITEDITWNEQKRLISFLESSPDIIFETIKTTQRRLIGIFKTEIVGEGTESCVKLYTQLAELANKNEILYPRYIQDLCNAINLALDKNKPIKTLTPNKAEEARTALMAAQKKLTQYSSIGATASL